MSSVIFVYAVLKSQAAFCELFLSILVEEPCFIFGALGGDLKAEVGGGCPADGIFDYSLDISVVERGAGLVARLEIKDLAAAADKAGTAPEDMTVLKPAAENECVGLGDIEGLAVELV